MDDLSDEKIVDSWRKNINPWIFAIRNNEIESRTLVTNNSIVEAIAHTNPKSVLDIGCGEGWLVRKLCNMGIKSTGVDIVPELIEYAKKEGGGEFRVLSYEQISPKAFKENFDVIVCNFSLLGKESVDKLVQQIPSLLNTSGIFIIQTIHPISGCGNGKYEDGWRKGSWEGFSEKFTDPAPWYFRTIESWQSLLSENKFSQIETIEPLNPVTNSPASIIFVSTKLY